MHELLQQRPYLTSSEAVAALDMSQPTADRSLRHLETLGILREASGKEKRRVYEYTRYLAILAEGTEPIRPGG